MADEYVELPDELIQHVQSFLDLKEAARTSVLSKLWYSAWSTYPILCLDYNNFPSTETRLTEFENFARTSINRYQKLNLKPNTFMLTMPWSDKDLTMLELTSLVDELILSALTLGVDDLSANIHHINYTLPNQVFSSVYLKKLYIDGCTIDLPQSNGQSRVVCSRLVSLELSDVRVSDDMMRDILLGCPLMEDLRVVRCYDLKKINPSVACYNLRTFSLIGQKLLVEWDEVNVQHQFHKLISLELSGVEVDDRFFEFIPHRFPCLERLELAELKLENLINVDIASNSLRHLSLLRIDGMRFIKVQVPNIQNFRLVTSRTEGIPSLSFITVSKEWRSDLGFRHSPGMDRDANVSWWLKIRNILRELSYSKIYLDIESLSDDQLGSISEEIIQRTHISPFVENLKIETRERHQNSFGWLLCCRPKYITWTYNYFREIAYDSRKKHGHKMVLSRLLPRICDRENLLELIYYNLKNHENKIASDPLPCIHGLDEVDMEHYDKTLREWCPVRPSLIEPRLARAGGYYRLRLKWT